MSRMLKFWPLKAQTTTTDAYEHFVAQMASSMALQELRAHGAASSPAARNAERTAAAAAAAVNYDITRDPVEYARPIADAIVHTVACVL